MLRECHIARYIASLAGLLVLAAPAYPEITALSGRPLEEAITVLEDRGLAVLYSTDLVKPGMTVQREPGASSPARILAEIVAPYELETRDGPAGSVLIVRRDGEARTATGTILGIVKNGRTGRRISGAEVALNGSPTGTVTSAGGHFSFSDLQPGKYSIRVRKPAHTVVATYDTQVEPGKTAVALINLEEPAVYELQSIVVSASRYALSSSLPTSYRFLPGREIANLPDLGDDALRAVGRLPGTATGGLTAQSNVRGGEANETLVLFDDLRLHNPFHLKDFQSIFSTIDPRIVSDIEVYTGGFPVTYGDRMSSVVDVASLHPADTRYTELAVSFFNAAVLSNGMFADGKGDWLVSARRGNLDLLIDEVDSRWGDPRYVDAFARIGYRLSDSLRLTGSMLFFDDDLDLSDTDQEEQAEATYQDKYYWLRLDHDLDSGFSGHTLLAHTRLSSHRSGVADQAGVSRGMLDDRRSFTVDSLQSDWTWPVNDALFLSFGGEFRKFDGKYDYLDEAEFDLVFITPGASMETERETELHVRPEGEHLGAYVSARVGLGERLTADLGLRWDKQTLVEGNDDQTSPRIGFVYQLAPRTRLRASWGRFYQSQGIDELPISDGVANYFRAQRSDHTVVSIEHGLQNGIDIRLEAYDKDVTDLRPRYENLLNELVLLPELKPDRIEIDPDSARSRGAELSVQRRTSDPLSWWLSYTWASVEDKFDGVEISRSWDQAHAFSGAVNWNMERWNIGLAATYHSGWPTTGVELVQDDPIPLAVAGPRNGEQVSAYRTVDLRVARDFRLENSSMTVFLELINMFARRNECCVEYEISSGEDDVADGDLELETVNYLSIIPSLGFVWRF